MIHDLCILMLTAGITSLVFKVLKQPVVLGYIVAGMLVGPHLLGDAWVNNKESVETWGEIGVLFLLFSLGLEFSFKKLIQVGSTAVIGAGVIVVGMLTTGYCVGMAMGWTSINSIFLGGMLCMSSTTIVFKAIDEAGLRSQRFAKVCFGILIVEDLFAVVLMVLLSSIAVKNTFEGADLLMQVGKLVLYLAAWFVLGILLIPTFLKRFKAHLNDETLTIFSIGLCLGMVLLAIYAGFSSALGAFVMGSVLAETVEAESIEHLVQPLKNVFGAIFFVSVGMMIDPALLVEYWLPITIITAVVILGQLTFATLGTLLSGQPLSVALQTGFSLVQIGEFAFIIASLGQSLNVTTPSLYPIIVAVSVITTFFTPYIMRMSSPAYAWLEKRMSPRTRAMLDRYSQSHQPTSQSSKNKTQNSKLNTLTERILLLLSITPGVKHLVAHFNRNLYARENAIEQSAVLKKDTTDQLLTLDIHISEFTVAENSNFCGKTLKSIDVRKHTGASIVGIVRRGININIPGGDHRIFPGDRLLVAGSDEQMMQFQQMLDQNCGSLTPHDNSRLILQQAVIAPDSPLCGKTIKDTDIRSHHQCIVMGLVKPQQGAYMNPNPDLTLSAGDTIILVGETNGVAKLLEML